MSAMITTQNIQETG